MTYPPKTRGEAKAIGAKFYLTGNPCPQNHNGLRYTVNGSCVECTLIRTKKQTESGYYNRRYKENSEEILKKNKKRYNSNPEVRARYLESSKRWVKNNPEKVRHIKQSYKARRRSKKAKGVGGGAVTRWAKSQEKVCYWCGKDCNNEYHVDHYEPLSRDGVHELDNLVIACASCNLRKSSKDPYEYAKEHGKLF